jgi:hypothetical protein
LLSPLTLLLASSALFAAACGTSSQGTTLDAAVPQSDAGSQDDAAVQDDAAPVQQDAAAASGIGDPCTASGMGQGTCADGQLCLSEELTQGQLPGGYCSAQCSGNGDCPSDATCVTAGGGYQLCLKTCAVESDCRGAEGYRCVAEGGTQICYPWAPPPGTIDGGACVGSDAGPRMNDPGRTFGASQQLVAPGSSFMEAETHVVAASTDGGVRVAAAYIAVFGNGDAKMAVNTSANGGQSFAAAVIVDDTLTSAKSDPVLAYSADRRYLFLTWIGYDYSSGGQTSNMHTFVARSDDHGLTWGTPVNASGADAGNKDIDKPWITTGPSGEVYVTYMASQGYDSSIRVARSVDNGLTFDPPVSAVDAGATDFVNLAYPATDADGNLYVGWIRMAGDQNGDAVNDVMVARWSAGGTWGTFATPVRANTDTDEVVFNDVNLVTAPGAGAQEVYAIYVAGSADDQRWNVRLAHSADRGATFSPAITVNDDGTCATHFLPAAAIDASGRVHVSWYDNRFGTSAGGLFYAAYDPVTHLVGASQYVSDEAFEFTIDRSTQNWLGDYTGLFALENTIFATWADPRGGENTSHVRFARGQLP